MYLLRNLSELIRFQRPISLALGVFDGVHLGHQAVIREAVRQARGMNGDAAILTFHPHPAKILRPEAAPPLLTTEQQDYELFSALDVDVCVILDFTRELSRHSASDFLNQLLQAIPHLRALIVGPRWHFGHERSGNFELLKMWAATQKLQALEVAPVCVDGEAVSSTMIRSQIGAGEIAAANARLGRPYQVVGRVVRGNGIGQKMGFPTANLNVESEWIPLHGVYAARAVCEQGSFPAAVNIGTRPTVSNSPTKVVEAHLLDFHGDLYGHHIRLDLMARVRDENKFEDLGDLKRQIEDDTRIIRSLVKDL